MRRCGVCVRVIKVATMLIGAGWLMGGSPLVQAQQEYDYERSPISYSDTEPRDAVQALERRIATGQVVWPPPTGGADQATAVETRALAMLRTLLAELGIDPSSQVLVFSKTSAQSDLIDAKRPRAVYFNQEAYVGYVRGGLIEVTCIDPALGPIFYALDPRASAPLSAAVGKPERRWFLRDESCLNCHGGIYSKQVPGLVVRSVPTAANGGIFTQFGNRVVDHTTPFEERWAGWLVTGRHGHGRHLGNSFASDEAMASAAQKDAAANLTDLAGLADLRPYLAQTSDIVALMILEHQCTVQTALTKGHYGATQRLVYQRALQESLGQPMSDEPNETTQRVFDGLAEEILDALLFKDEAALPEGGIEGGDAFRVAYGAGGGSSASPADSAERSAPSAVDRVGARKSLRRLQLLTRLFKVRLSPMLDSVSFQHLQPTLKRTVLGRLKQVIQTRDERYAYLTAFEKAEMKKVLQVLEPSLDW